MNARYRKRLLIINADDLGYAEGVNRAVEICARENAISSATIMANGKAFSDAVEFAVRGKIGIGVHLVLTELEAVSGAEEAPGLVDENGALPATPLKLFGKILRGEVGGDVIRKELSRQVEKVFDHGIRPTHLDSHKHVHALPQVLDAVVKVAGKYSIKGIRNPFETAPTCALAGAVAKESAIAFWRQHAKARLLAIFRTHFLRTVKLEGLFAPGTFFGVSLTGVWNERALKSILSKVPPGASELMVHPGLCDEDLRRMPTRLKTEREKELELLLSGRMRSLRSKYGIEIRQYGEDLR